MRFQPDPADGVNVVARREPGRLWVGGQMHASSLLIPWRGQVTPWRARGFDALVAADFEAVLQWRLDVLIFGSGSRLRFASPALLRSLIDQGIGVETMDTAAACRTYNVLAAEGRAVVAALLVGCEAAA